uniref:hypothetical protein n=1 Tax=Asaia astilbis TaxID=610244 RepID=UPI00056083B7
MPGTLELAPKARCVFYCAGALAALTSLMPASALAGPIAVDQGTGDSIRCPSGIVRVAEIEAIIQGDANRSGGQTIGSASVEICADNETKYIDIVTRGAPDEAAGNGSPGRKTGVDGSIQIHGRTARLNANIYVPLT